MCFAGRETDAHVVAEEAACSAGAAYSRGRSALERSRRAAGSRAPRARVFVCCVCALYRKERVWRGF